MTDNHAQNNAGSTPKPGGCTGKGFTPGTSGNPGGRPKNCFGEVIREATQWGQELADVVLKVLRTTRSDAVRINAATWLADRGFGKPLPADVPEFKLDSGIVQSLVDDLVWATRRSLPTHCEHCKTKLEAKENFIGELEVIANRFREREEGEND